MGSRHRIVREFHEPLESSSLRRETDPVHPSEREYAPNVSLKNINASQRWRPKSLRKRVFFACAFVFLACVVTFAVVFSYSRSNQGLLKVDTRLHYLWTYAPTLFFTIVGACWARVAYRTLQMQPWRMIARDPTSTSKALLVDYVTPIALKSLFKAARARHFLAVLVLLVSLALQIVTILSTGLFEVEYVSIQKHGPISLIDTITGASHDFSNIGAGPALTIYSVQNTNLSYPEGTTSAHAVPKLSYSDVSNATLVAPVGVFTSYLDCQEASLQLDNTSITSQTGGLHNAPLFTYSLNTSDCLLPNLTVEGGAYLDYNYEGDNFTFYDTYGNTAAVACSQNASDVRIRISAGLIYYNITWNGTFADTENETLHLLEKTPSELFQLSASTNLLCIPHYGLQEAEVTYTTSQTTGSRQAHIQEPNSTSLQALEGVTPQAISNAIMDSITASWEALEALFPNPNAGVITVNDPSEGSDGYFPTNPDAFFRIMTQQYPLANGSSRSSWFDPETLRTASSLFFGSVAAQFAAQYLRRDATGTVQGTAGMVQPRLVFSSVFYAVEALLGSLFLAALLHAWPATKAITSIDPASIGGTTAIISADVALMDHFHGTGTFDLDMLKAHLRGPGSGDDSKARTYGRTFGTNAEPNWVAALGVSTIREMIPLIPLLLIVGLEISLHYSEVHNGIAIVDGLRSRIHASRLVPAVVFAATHMVLSSMAFNVSLMHPFSTLRTSPSAAQISLLDAPLSRFAPHNLWLSARRKQFALFCSVVMTITTFFLVTVSSGLFVSGGYTRSSHLTQLSWFQLSSENNDSAIHNLTRRYNLTEPLQYAEDNGETKMHLIGNAVIELNLSYPAWTYDELALPLVSISGNSTLNVTDSIAISAQIPALRTDMQCDVLKTDENNITFSQSMVDVSWDYSFGVIYTRNLLDVHTNFSVECGGSGQSNATVVIYEVALPSRLNTSEEGSVEPRPTSMLYSYENCLVGIYGYANNAKFVNYSVMSCKVSYEEVQATMTFLDFPSYRISSDAPPIVDESTTKPINSSDVSSFLAATEYSASFYNTSLTSLNGYSTMDPVSTALIYGKDGVPAEKLFPYSPEQYLIPNLQHLIRTMGAQYISYFYRSTNTTSPLVNSRIPATLQMNSTYRLRQTATSTRILDGLLAASGVFAILTLLTFRTRDVVKAKLGSPAVVMAMVADSEFVRELQKEQSLEPDETDRAVHAERMLASDGGQFSLGWWEVRGSSTSSQSEGQLTKYRWAIDIGRSD
ncbi:hypothetical protein EDD36DRAFT_461890 [Exophiala viscosa]|uniref:Uncharacterized protein n=1 Tax=Exophiala viscosa TaxID=2486360 RepID=A0AAN6E4P5_9EURO|nr:hypothetical protein EDD36DRAFT_461890 [Exophiala viscosa]